MKSAFLTKAALCICPPAVIATTAATVPPVRHAVHRFTAAYEPHHKATISAAPCVPVQHKTFASELPSGGNGSPVDLNEQAMAMNAVAPGGGTDIVGPQLVNTSTPLLPLGPGLVPTTGTGTGTTPGGGGTTPGGGDTPGVPEPSVWLTMVLGFGMVGAGYRQRRRSLARDRALATAGPSYQGGQARLSSSASGVMVVGAALVPAALNPAQAGTKLAQLGSKALHSSMLAKAAMCVCPPVAMALGTAAVPPVRHAVYKATSPSVPHTPGRSHATVAQGIPCVPVSVPTAAEAVQQGNSGKLAVLDESPTWPVASGE